GTGMTVGPHPVSLERDRLRRLGVRSAAELTKLRNGQRVRAGGVCIVRQRPGTAKGFVFLSLEDETGISNIVIDPPTFEKNRRPPARAPAPPCCAARCWSSKAASRSTTA